MIGEDQEGWDGEGGGRLEREGIYAYLQMIHAALLQKLTQDCKAIGLHSGKKNGRKYLQRTKN